MKNIFFYGSWVLLAAFCLLSNLINHLLTVNSNAAEISILSAAAVIIGIVFLAVFPIGTAVKLRNKPFWTWMTAILAAAGIWSFSEAFGITHPYVDDVLQFMPFTNFVILWGVIMFYFTFIYILPLAAVFFVMNRKKQKTQETSLQNKIKKSVPLFFTILFTLILIISTIIWMKDM